MNKDDWDKHFKMKDDQWIDVIFVVIAVCVIATVAVLGWL